MKYFVIDGLGLVFRSYFAFKNLLTTNGMQSGWLYGFLAMLRSLKNKYGEFHFIVAWDSEAKRKKEIYSAYKANRQKNELADYGDLRIVLNNINIGQADCAGEEADDVIATLTRNLGDSVIYVYSSDKDLLQLVKNGKVIVIKPKSGANPEKIFDEELVKTEFGVMPENLACYLALRGDTVDNIKGIPRIPSKIVSLLSEKYKEPQTIYANLGNEKLTNNLRNSFLTFEKQIYMNYQLTKLDYNLGIKMTEGKSDENVINTILEKYEIRTIKGKQFISLFENEGSFLNRQAPSIENFSLF
jgi:DNA polymerase-1